MTDFDAEIAALEKQIADAQAAKAAASQDATKAARIAELKAELAALGETTVIAAPFQSPVSAVTQVGTEHYHVVPPEATIEGTIVPVPPISEPVEVGEPSTIVPVTEEALAPSKAGTIQEVR